MYKCEICKQEFETKKGNISRFAFRDVIVFDQPEELLIDTGDVCWPCKQRVVDQIRGFLNGTIETSELDSTDNRLRILEGQVQLLMIALMPEQEPEPRVPGPDADGG